MKFFLMSELKFVLIVPLLIASDNFSYPNSVGPEIIFTSNGIYYFTNKINLFDVFIYFIPLDTEIY